MVSACRRVIGSKPVGNLIAAYEPGVFVIEHKLDELSKQGNPVAATDRLRVQCQHNAPFTNLFVQVCEFAFPDVENVFWSPHAYQIRNTGHELEKRNIIEVPSNRYLDQIDRVTEHKGLVPRSNVT